MKILRRVLLCGVKACQYTADGTGLIRFGDHGVQPGDGTSTISDAEFTSQLTTAVLDFVG